MSQSAAENLFALWDTYEKVVAGNYMFHREIAEEITRALSARAAVPSRLAMRRDTFR